MRMDVPREVLGQCDGIHIDGEVLGCKEFCDLPESCWGGFVGVGLQLTSVKIGRILTSIAC